jgi:hypothetical protein
MPKDVLQIQAALSKTKRQPIDLLAEVFGFPSDVRTAEVEHFRSFKLCPFRPLHDEARRDLSTPHERVPFDQQFGRCTKDSKKNPLGVCSVKAGDVAAITCPVRFSEAGVMIESAASWSAAVLGLESGDLLPVSEVRLVPAAEQEMEDQDDDLTVPEVVETSAGNIDYVLAHIDAPQPGSTRIDDYAVNAYAALEVQAVYISGNVRNLFSEYMGGDAWDGENPPRPDWLSSSRKRLVPQLAWKGSVLHAWGRPIAVSVQAAFWDTMPYLQRVTTDRQDSDAFQQLAWVIVDLKRRGDLYHIEHVQTVYSTFDEALAAATQTPAGSDRLVKAAILKKYIKATTGKNPTAPKIDKAKPNPTRKAKSRKF